MPAINHTTNLTKLIVHQYCHNTRSFMETFFHSTLHNCTSGMSKAFKNIRLFNTVSMLKQTGISAKQNKKAFPEIT